MMFFLAAPSASPSSVRTSTWLTADGRVASATLFHYVCEAGALTMYEADDARSMTAVRADFNPPRRCPAAAAEYCDARQVLSETLRLRRAAQLQRAAAAAAADPPPAPSGLLRSDEGTGASKRRKKARDRPPAAPRPPRARRIMFHEYKGPPDDSVDVATATSLSATRLVASSPLYFASSSPPFASSLTADFRPPSSSPLPRFSELQRSLRPPAQTPQFTEHLGSRPGGTVGPRSGCTPTSLPHHPSTFVDAAYCRSAPTTVSVASSSSSLSTSSVGLFPRPPLCVTSSIGSTSGLLATSGVADDVTARLPSVVATYRPTNGDVVTISE